MIKRIVALFSWMLVLVALAGMLGGCSLFKSGTTAASTAVATVTDKLCNPTDTQKQDAALALAAIDAIQQVVAAFIPQANLIKASAVFSMIQQGTCVLLTDLAAALATLDAANQVAIAKGTKAPVMPLTSLRTQVPTSL